MQDTDWADQLDQNDLTPRENLAMAVRYAREHIMCPADPAEDGWDHHGWDDHGHSQCWATGTLIAAVEELTAWIRGNRGRLHRPTCMDGNGCRCGLGDLPMWGAAG